MFNRISRIVCCSVVVVAALSSSLARAAEPINKLQSLVNETAAQIQLAYQRDPNERDERQQQVAAVLSAWRNAPRSEGNNEQLASWLRAAIASSMPGSREPLPAGPKFATIAKVGPALEARVPEASVLKTPSAEAATRVESTLEKDVDPFRDDPVGETK